MKVVERSELPVLGLKFTTSFIGLTILAGLAVGVARVLTSLYAVHIQASALQLGLIAAAQSIGLLLMALPVGVLLQRFGSLVVFSVGSIIAAALYLIQAWYVNAWSLLLLTALVSCVLPMRFVSIHSVFLHHLSRLGPAKAGWFRGSHMLGFFLIAPSLTVLLIEYLGYQHAFFTVAALFVSAIVVAPMCLQQHSLPPIAKQQRSCAALLAPLSLLKKHRQLRTICSLEFLSNSANNYFGFFIVVIAIQNFALDESTAVMLLTVQGLVFVASLFSLGTWAEILGYYKFYLISLALISLALSVLSITPTAFWLWPASIGLGLGLGMLHIANFMSFAKVGEQSAIHQVSPLLALVGPAGGLLGGLAGAAFGQYVGLQNLFAPLGLAFITMTLFILKNLNFQKFLQTQTTS